RPEVALVTRSAALIVPEVRPVPEGRNDAKAEELGDGDPRPGAAGGPFRDPVAAQKRVHQEEGQEWSVPLQASARSGSPGRVEEQGCIGRDRYADEACVGNHEPQSRV